MAQRYENLLEQHIQFIQQQHLYFVATATADSHINLSPKGADTLRVLSANKLIWLNLTGSGNESAAHVPINPRMTIMFCSFDAQPLILRIYGNSRVIHQDDLDWSVLIEHFPALPGARQIFELEIKLVQTSCGYGIPLYSYQGERNTLIDWANKKGEAGIQQYWADKNQHSLDGLPTHIIKSKE